jgi:predicted nuclease with TOPRIM domain
MPPDPERSKTVYRCPYCHTKTNLHEPIGFPAGNLRVRCPVLRDRHGELEDQQSEKHDKHDQLVELVDRHEEVSGRIDLYGDDTPDALTEELDVLEDRIADLREWFDEQDFDDVVDANEQGELRQIGDSWCT